MANKIEVISKIPDTRAEVRKKKLVSIGFPVDEVQLTDAYTIEAPITDLPGFSSLLANPVVQDVRLNRPVVPERFDYAIEVGFLPGVTDNVGNTAREIAEDFTGKPIEGQGVYSSQIMFLSGDLSKEDAIAIGSSLSNPVIQRASVKSREEFIRDGGMDVIVPRVRLREEPAVDIVDLLNAPDESLAIIGKQGIANKDGTRRGPLALDLLYMKAIKGYFKERGRNPTDVELESIAQTWSEHCKHTIFADQIDDIKDGLFKTYIRNATNQIRKAKGKKDICVSVFTDNAGGIIFDDKHLVVDKAETHNSPSALDPFGGSITGIVGVNRDPMGFGMGAKPIVNRYGFCFANPEDARKLYKGKDKTQPMLSSRRIMDGVIEGVNVGGNCSGIPTPQGFTYFDESYRGKPLVFVGTVGLIPRKKNGKQLHLKGAKPGDYVVMAGGKVGKDGIHGATFSSEAIDSGSPATAVQIGDPITQKKMSDAIVKEARDRRLYTSITDNGAGGLSCSIAEMARESGGCEVYLDKVPLKYPGLEPWEIWVSESQERMTLSVPEEKLKEFQDLMKSRGVEATVVGKFTDSGKCTVDYKGKRVMDVEMDFLHDGLPPRPIKTVFTKKTHEEPKFECLEDLTDSLHSMLRRQNITSSEFISRQYDHEVQGGSVIKPLQGRGRVNGDATVVRPVLGSKKAIVLSHALNPNYSEIDTYHMAACAVDTAIRNAVAVGANLDNLALLDNFCWCSSTEPERLGQLKRACEACYDSAVAFGTPFISGKDSMFNDFKGFDENGKPIKISVLPTLLVSSLGVIEDARKAVSLDAKMPGDLVYVLGGTFNEMGGSEYFAMKGEQMRGEKYIGNRVPTVDFGPNKKGYIDLSRAIEMGLVASAQSIHRGGLAIALAKKAMGGMLGMDIDLRHVPGTFGSNHSDLFSESQGRIVVTVNPKYQKRFERTMHGNTLAQVGVVRGDDKFTINAPSGDVVKTSIGRMLEAYRSTFKNY